jgi:hypothetical protein
MKFFLDTEFLEDGHTIDLISIGIKAEDGREYYAINEEAGWHHIINNDWLRENVLPSLPIEVTTCRKRQSSFHHYRLLDSSNWRTHKEIAEDVKLFVGANPEFWGYYADYDWVAFCQLFGRMIDLPEGFPMYCRDLKQWLDKLYPVKELPLRLPEQEDEHHALADAKWNMQVYNLLYALDNHDWVPY